MGYVYRFGDEHPKMVDSEKIQKVKIYAEIVAILKSIGLTDEAIEYALKTPATTLRRWSEKQGYECRKRSMYRPFQFKKICGEKERLAKRNDERSTGGRGFFSTATSSHTNRHPRSAHATYIFCTPRFLGVSRCRLYFFTEGGWIRMVQEMVQEMV